MLIDPPVANLDVRGTETFPEISRAVNCVCGFNVCGFHVCGISVCGISDISGGVAAP